MAHSSKTLLHAGLLCTVVLVPGGMLTSKEPLASALPVMQTQPPAATAANTAPGAPAAQAAPADPGPVPGLRINSDAGQDIGNLVPAANGDGVGNGGAGGGDPSAGDAPGEPDAGSGTRPDAGGGNGSETANGGPVSRENPDIDPGRSGKSRGRSPYND